ncbi:ABC transporter substrate-binding protein [Amorphus sp. 3PC139-8]|uniref:ABC transporter substrate-binding protein n=1 Tax=Amorphus sp. 3PC139-8 TaxID=2735676 RepID=UPI00345D019E
MRDLNRRHFLHLTAGAAVAGGLSVMPRAAFAQAKSVEALYEAAKAEGKLVYYAAANVNITRRVVAAFNELYPGIEVEILRLATSQMAQRFMSEHQAGNYANDLIQLSDPFVLQDAADRGWLAPLSELPAAATYPADAKTEYWALIGIAAHTIIYNTDLVSEAESPKTWEDLLDPKWKGQIILSDPRNNLEVADWLYTMYDAYGEDYLVALKAQDPQFVPSILPGLQMLAAGDGKIIAPGLHQATMIMLDKGAPVADVAPALDSGQESLVAVCSNAKSPNAARLLANFLLTPAGQAAYCAGWAASVLPEPVPGAIELSPQHKRARYEQALAERDKLVAILGL